MPLRRTLKKRQQSVRETQGQVQGEHTRKAGQLVGGEDRQSLKEEK